MKTKKIKKTVRKVVKSGKKLARKAAKSKVAQEAWAKEKQILAETLEKLAQELRKAK